MVYGVVDTLAAHTYCRITLRRDNNKMWKFNSWKKLCWKTRPSKHLIRIFEHLWFLKKIHSKLKWDKNRPDERLYHIYSPRLFMDYSSREYLIGRNFVGRKWRISLKVTKISPDKVLPNNMITICLNVRLLVLNFKTLFLLCENFRRAKVKNFSFSDKSFARPILSPDESFAR